MACNARHANIAANAGTYRCGMQQRHIKVAQTDGGLSMALFDFCVMYRDDVHLSVIVKRFLWFRLKPHIDSGARCQLASLLSNIFV